ncbi:MAG: histidinol-phosphatase HisJ family protein [Bacillota bacterium]
MIDYHIHTPLCRHAVGSMGEYLAEAGRKGLIEIGFADHFPLGLLEYIPRSQVTMDPDELAGYMEDVRQLALSSAKITVKLGVEVDYLPGKERKLRELLSCYPFDYIIGSIHFLDDWDFTHPFYARDYQNRDLKRLYRRYFALVEEACLSGLFDLIGHIDVIKKFGFSPDEDLEPYWSRTASVLKETGTCLELNTAGRDAPVGEFYPHRRLLELCLEQGVAVTIGSDAHTPEQVGRHFPEAETLLKEIGFGEIAVFTNRRRGALKMGACS